MSAERTWTGNSEVDAAIVMLDRIDCSPEDDSRVDEVEATLRRQHARIQELEAHITKLTTWKNEGELEIRAWDTMKEQERKIIELEKMLETLAAPLNVWQQAIDAELVSAHLGVAPNDATFEGAQKAIHELICWHIDVATHPATNGGQRLTDAKPIVLPEPFALYDGEKWYANEEAAICSCATIEKLQKVFTEQQVRELLARDLGVEPPPQADALDADFEAVRKKLCKLQRYSFWLDESGGVRRVDDRCGNWIEFDAAHELFDPVAIDAAIAAAKGE